MTRTEFGQYVQTEYDKLLRFVRSRINNTQDAEDVLQKALMRLLMICHTINPQAPDGFIFTALRNGMIDYWRRRGRRPPECELPEQVPGDESSVTPAEDQATEDRCKETVRAAAATLTERERRAFTAYWRARGDRSEALDGLGLAEAGKEEKYRVYDGPLFHAKRKLAQALQPQAGVLSDVGHARLWELVYEVLGGGPAEAAW
jgi:RNA polymerase sigma factor (sigma-70 family)